MLKGTIDGSDVTLALEELKTLDQRALAAGAAGLRNGLRMVARIAQNEFLSGPRPGRLGVVTGLLRSSLVTNVQVQDGKVTGSITTDVAYGAYHEQGFHGTVQVRQYKRAAKGAHGAKRPGLVTVGFVRAHRRRIDYAGRPFLAPALERGGPMVLEEIQKALAAV